MLTRVFPLASQSSPLTPLAPQAGRSPPGEALRAACGWRVGGVNVENGRREPEAGGPETRREGGAVGRRYARVSLPPFIPTAHRSAHSLLPPVTSLVPRSVPSGRRVK